MFFIHVSVFVTASYNHGDRAKIAYPAIMWSE